MIESSADWDVVVIGAGPAGAVAAREIVRQGARVLLADKAIFPRHKVCGCCLNGAALAALAAAGLADLPARQGAAPLSRFHFSTAAASAVLEAPLGVSLSRQAFDAALVEEAIRAGACFVPSTSATVGMVSARGIEIILRSAESDCTVRQSQHVQARVVLVADGLAGRSLANRPDLAACRARNSRVGAGAVLADGPTFYAAGTIYMACGRGGYVGLVRLEDGRLNVAAAFDLAAVRNEHGPGPLAARLLGEVGLSVPPLLVEAAWHGTPPLTIRRRVAGERIFVVGDAAGYVEPFTGEGMAWAIRSALAVKPLALAAIHEWSPQLARRWESVQGRIVRRRQDVCRRLTRLLRYPTLAAAGALALNRFPRLAAPLIRALNSEEAVHPLAPAWELSPTP